MMPSSSLILCCSWSGCGVFGLNHQPQPGHNFFSRTKCGSHERRRDLVAHDHLICEAIGFWDSKAKHHPAAPWILGQSEEHRDRYLESSSHLQREYPLVPRHSKPFEAQVALHLLHVLSPNRWLVVVGSTALSPTTPPISSLQWSWLGLAGYMIAFHCVEHDSWSDQKWWCCHLVSDR